MLFTTPAYASTPAPAGGGIEVLIPFVLIFVVFYFFLIRPQQKKMKQHREMVSAIGKGDEIVTSGGILGRVIKVINEQDALIEIADNVEVVVKKATISDVVKKKNHTVKANTVEKKPSQKKPVSNKIETQAKSTGKKATKKTAAKKTKK